MNLISATELGFKDCTYSSCNEMGLENGAMDILDAWCSKSALNARKGLTNDLFIN